MPYGYFISFLSSAPCPSQFDGYGKIDVDENMRALVHNKSNLAPPGVPLTFGLEPAGGFTWLGEYDISIDELLAEKKQQPENQFAKARRLIEKALAGGPVPAADMEQMAEEQGISPKTLHRAKSALSVIEKPGLSKGYNRAEYLGESRAPTVRDRLRGLMDDALAGCKDYDSYLATLQTAGVEMKRGKQLAFKLPGGKKFVRQDTLGEDYSPQAIRERIAGTRGVAVKPKPTESAATAVVTAKPNLLIDIQEKMQQGYGEGYRRWVTTFNLKESAKTLLYLQERGLDDYGLLTERASAATARFSDLSGGIKAAEKRLAGIATLQKHIGVYSKTREVYRQYRALPAQKRTAFFEEHRADIAVHMAAKEHFDSLGYGKSKKLPAMDSLRREYAVLDAERRNLSQNYRAVRDEMVALQRAKHNVDSILSGPRQHPKSPHRDRDAL